MASIDLRVTRNADGTATFRTIGHNGRPYVEHIDTRDLGMFQTYERLKYAAITAGMSLSEQTLHDLFRIAKGL